jgi:hypothetical protein
MLVNLYCYVFYDQLWKLCAQLLPDQYIIKAQGVAEALITKERRAQQHKE